MNVQNNNNNQFQVIQPVFKQYAVGEGIDQREYNSIISSAMYAYINKMLPMSIQTTNLIKQSIQGEWFVFVSELGSKNFDFCLTTVQGSDYMTFSLDNVLFQICRLRD
jgi:hypothetical protein